MLKVVKGLTEDAFHAGTIWKNCRCTINQERYVCILEKEPSRAQYTALFIFLYVYRVLGLRTTKDRKRIVRSTDSKCSKSECDRCFMFSHSWSAFDYLTFTRNARNKARRMNRIGASTTVVLEKPTFRPYSTTEDMIREGVLLLYLTHSEGGRDLSRCLLTFPAGKQ